MGMSTFGLMILLCLLSVCTLVKSASILESSSDLWQNWLLNENDEEIPSQQSSPLTRRITPKSVFLAPAFRRCSEGYRPDGMGNCVEIIRLNEAAQLESVLERLKQMAVQHKRQSQRNDTSNNNNNSNNSEKIINHPTKVSNEETDNTGPFQVQLSIPFDSKNYSSAETQPQNDTATGIVVVTSTEKLLVKEISTTARPTTVVVPETTTVESSISQNTQQFVDYATEETTDVQDTTTFGSADYQEDTESNQYSTESVNTEATVADSSTEDTVSESVPNVASHFADFDITDDATEITPPHVIKRIPNYNSIVPLKGVVNANKNVQQVSIVSSGGGNVGGLTNFRPFSAYTAANSHVNNFTNANTSKHPAVHIAANSFDKNEDVDEQSTSTIPSDVFQKLPPGERTKPKCDSNNRLGCLLQMNVYRTHKPSASSSAFVRFPSETSQKGYVRFPPPQKVPVEYDDVALAESSPGHRYWDRRYPSTLWSSWKSKPQFIQIRVPESSAGALYGVADTNMNYIRSHPHFQTQTEWYKK